MKVDSLNNRYILTQQNFTNQYNKLYNSRLNQTKSWIKIDKETIVGTVFKEQKNRLEVLKYFAAEFTDEQMDAEESFCSDSDKVYLENAEKNRTLLVFEDKEVIHQICTGLVLGFKGETLASGAFSVKEVIYPKPKPPGKHQCLNSKLMFISGLRLQQNMNKENFVPLLLLSKFIQSKGINHVVLAGNNFIRSPEAKSLNFEMTKKEISKSLQNKLVENIELFDSFIGGLLEENPALTIEIMPGDEDLMATKILPQQKFHRSTFLSRNQFKGRLRLTTNPNKFNIQAVNITCLGESGQIDENLLKQTKFDTHLDLMKTKLNKWCNLAPNCPDTLSCYPLDEQDVFTQNEIPNIYFSGGCPKFSTEYYNDTRYICIPKFRDSREAVIVDLSCPQLETTVVKFQEDTSSSHLLVDQA
eukprot:snap_masked-scaffold_13-processed-gene-3.23-mRNA-1 protein AED:1.00 eAED:1.00 QI:0/0/0/0/1/1/2/0/414